MRPSPAVARRRFQLLSVSLATVAILGGCGEERPPASGDTLPATSLARFTDLSFPSEPWAATVERSFVSGVGRELDVTFAGGPAAAVPGLLAAIADGNLGDGWVTASTTGMLVLTKGDEVLQISNEPGSDPAHPRIRYHLEVRP